ncbi:MAG: aldo/keto reductase [Bryobacterales bacterium]|nr:aldo/keto reductase [Bryobacterales bacterium]
MSESECNRREFVGTVAAAGVLGSTAEAAQGRKGAAVSRRGILNFNEKMEYRRLGKTGLMVSAVAMGGHWKRVKTALTDPAFEGNGYSKTDFDNLNHTGFIQNRHDVVSRAIDSGINYIDACTGEEVCAYAKVLKGRRQKMYLGYSWYQKEPRRKEYRTVARLMESLDEGLRQAGLDYVDLWRVTLPQDGLPDLAELQRIEEVTFAALERAKKQGKVRFTGVSTHNRPWLKSVIEAYPKQMEVAVTPYTADTKELPGDSVFAAIRKFNVGVFGIKPFGDNSLFKGDSSLTSPNRDEDDRRARLAIRYILHNPAITAPIPGLVNIHQVDNVARAVAERRELDAKEKAELEQAGREMWANLRPGYGWLRNWEYV